MVDGVVVATISDGVVATVNSKTADDNGNVALTATDIPYTAAGSTTVKSEIDDRQMDTKKLDAETEIANEDAFPFYDASEGINRKTLWSNIVTKLKSLFLSLAGGTATGNIIVQTNGDAYFKAVNTANNYNVWLDVDGTKAGLYLGHKQKWIIYNDGTTTTVDNTIPATAGAVGTTNLADKAVTAAKLATDAVKLTFTNKSVAASAFASNSTYADFPYRAAVALTGVTAAMIPEVFFGLTDAMSGNFAPVAESYAGGIYIYAAAKPSATVTIPTILCWR